MQLLGAEVYLYFDVQGTSITARVAPTTKAKNGSQVRFALDTNKIHVFDKATELAIVN